MKSQLWLVALFGLRHMSGARKLVIAALLALLPAGLVLVVRWVGPAGAAAEILQSGVPNLCLAVTGLLALFLGCGCMRDLLEERTLGMLLTRPISRGRLAFGLLLSAMILSCFLAAFGAALSFAVSSVGVHADVATPAPEAFLLVGAILLLAIVHTTLFALIGLRFRKSTVLGVVWLFVVEAGLGSIPGPARRLSPIAMVEGILSPEFTSRARIESADGESAVSPETALIVLAVMQTILLVLHQRRAARMDFLSANVSADGP